METRAVYDGIWGFIQIYVWTSNLPNILGDEDVHRQTEKEVLVWTIEKLRWLGCTLKMFFFRTGDHQSAFFALLFAHSLFWHTHWLARKKDKTQLSASFPWGMQNCKQKQKKTKDKKNKRKLTLYVTGTLAQ